MKRFGAKIEVTVTTDRDRCGSCPSLKHYGLGDWLCSAFDEVLDDHAGETAVRCGRCLDGWNRIDRRTWFKVQLPYISIVQVLQSGRWQLSRGRVNGAGRWYRRPERDLEWFESAQEAFETARRPLGWTSYVNDRIPSPQELIDIDRARVEAVEGALWTRSKKQGPRPWSGRAAPGPAREAARLRALVADLAHELRAGADGEIPGVEAVIQPSTQRVDLELTLGPDCQVVGRIYDHQIQAGDGPGAAAKALAAAIGVDA